MNWPDLYNSPQQLSMGLQFIMDREMEGANFEDLFLLKRLHTHSGMRIFSDSVASLSANKTMKLYLRKNVILLHLKSTPPLLKTV